MNRVVGSEARGLMSGTGDWGDVAERVKRAILGRFGHYATFARTIDMDPTQLAATLRPHRRPTVETLDRFSVALGWNPNVLREWYGYALADVGMAPVPVPPTEGDRPFDPTLIVRYVESKPDEEFQAGLAREKERRRGKPGSYERLCLRIYRAWTSNADLVMGELEVVETE